MEHFPLVDRLHTDVLESKYGPISAKVLQHDEQIRMTHLIDKSNVSRTFAITFLKPKDWSSEIKEINQHISEGEAIGKAFREKGYAIRKNVLDVYIVELPPWLQKQFSTKMPAAKARISEFYAKKDGVEPIIYGEVVEIYSPDFRGPAINETDKKQISALTKKLEEENCSKEEIWDRITRGNDWSNKIPNLKRARINSTGKILNLKQKINETLNTQNI